MSHHTEPEPWTAGPKASWIQVDTDARAFVCLRCGRTEDFPVPVVLFDWTERGFAFVADHRSCLPPVKPVTEVETQGSLL